MNNRNYESKLYLLRLQGHSSDGRAKKWMVTCKSCKKSHEPQTTLMRYQYVQCACGISETIDYNTLTQISPNEG